MYKGTSASAGIGIGKAVIVEEAQLVITRQAVNNVEEEVQRFKGALSDRLESAPSTLITIPTALICPTTDMGPLTFI